MAQLMKFETQTSKTMGSPVHRRRRRAAGFTLAEVLAALLLLAMVVPLAVEALHVASAAGQLAARRSEAARVAERVLNEAIASGAWSAAAQAGEIEENGHQYHWTLRQEAWPEDAMQCLTAEVTFRAQERNGAVRLSTLVSPAS